MDKHILEIMTFFRLLILGFTDGFVVLAVIIGVFAAFFSKGKPSMIAAFISFFAIFMTWFNVAVHFPFSVVVADLCYDTFDYTIEQRIIDRDNSYGVIYQGLDTFIHCASWNYTNDTYFWADQLRTEAIQQQQALGNSTGLNSTVYNQLQATIDILESTEVDCLYVRECRWLLNAFEPFQTGDLCTQKLEGCVIVWATSFVTGILLIGFTVATILGCKRFPESDDYDFF